MGLITRKEKSDPPRPRCDASGETVKREAAHVDPNPGRRTSCTVVAEITTSTQIDSLLIYFLGAKTNAFQRVTLMMGSS